MSENTGNNKIAKRPWRRRHLPRVNCIFFKYLCNSRYQCGALPTYLGNQRRFRLVPTRQSVPAELDGRV